MSVDFNHKYVRAVVGLAKSMAGLRSSCAYRVSAVRQTGNDSINSKTSNIMRKSILTVICLSFLTFTAIAQTYCKELEKRAKNGDIKATIEMFYCYKQGFGIKANPKKALIWYNKAVEDLKPALEACDAKSIAYLGYLPTPSELENTSNMVYIIEYIESWLLNVPLEKRNSVRLGLADIYFDKDRGDLGRQILQPIIDTGTTSEKKEIADFLKSRNMLEQRKDLIRLLAKEGDAESQLEYANSFPRNKYGDLAFLGMYWLEKAASQGNESAIKQFEEEKIIAEKAMQKEDEESRIVAEKEAKEKRIAAEKAEKARQEKMEKYNKTLPHNARYVGEINDDALPHGVGNVIIPYKGKEIRLENMAFKDGWPVVYDKTKTAYAYLKVDNTSFLLYSYERSDYRRYWYFSKDGRETEKFEILFLDDLVSKIYEMGDYFLNYEKYYSPNEIEKGAKLDAKKDAERERTHFHEIPIEERCRMCAGEGTIGYHEKSRCPQCYGRGYVLNHYPLSR